MIKKDITYKDLSEAIAGESKNFEAMVVPAMEGKFGETRNGKGWNIDPKVRMTPPETWNHKWNEGTWILVQVCEKKNE